MEAVTLLLLLLVGLAVGFSCAWLINRSKNAGVMEHARATVEGEQARLKAQLEASERRVADLTNELRSKDERAAQLQADVSREIERRSKAEAGAARIPEFERLVADLNTRIEQAYERITIAIAREAELVTERDKERLAAVEKLAIIDDAQRKLIDTFSALSAEALQRNNESFISLARTQLEGFQELAREDLTNRQAQISEVVQPVKDSLALMGTKLQELEVAREGAYQLINEQVRSLAEGQTHLRDETTKLVSALRSPTTRGRWGEVQLKRVVELAGMLSYCDFCEQTTVATETGSLRPDLIVKLPGGRTIVVDSKAPLEAYLAAHDQAHDDEARAKKFKEHAGHLRGHINSLSGKSYWQQFQPAPEFVLLFLPGEAFYSSALEHDPSLIEHGVEKGVILTTPTTLIALLKAVSYGWRQEAVAENSQRISELGRALYERTAKMAEHFAKLGGSLKQAVESYNDAIGSVERRWLVSARRFKEFGAVSQASGDVEALNPLDNTPRSITAPELIALSADELG
jgi:DNA recombination protein RmuC